MNLKKKKEIVDNFIKLNDIVSLNRSLSLITIQQLMKKIKKQEKALIAHMSFLNQLSRKPKRIDNQPKTLYIYYAVNEKFTTGFYDNIEKYLQDHFSRQHDLLITIGEHAKHFSETVLSTNPDFHYLDVLDLNSIARELAWLSQRNLKAQRVNQIVFLIRSNKTPAINTVLYPLEDFNFQLSLDENEKSFFRTLNQQQFQFFESAKEFEDNALISFLTHALRTLLLESSFIVYKNKLIHENKILKDLEVRIKRAKMSLNRSMREQEIQELNLIHDHKKQGLKKYDKALPKNHH
ncbi:hypothetical protein OF375_00060 [Ureaplasma miroungigenitalium]|uniref:MSC_0622 family F1-like ATPase gamma subunit n=1 Tax=Ureaplasma miroungigenitalium TaxID=1042321 RepID=UPI0021E70C13|nr:hypothetical protein [Ureaplasma miroungigenitalium]MCV3733987.1 hypothetical protein [Ureaplasma miroungigenitalium]